MLKLLKEIAYTPVSLVKGLWVTLVHIFRKKVTLQYPDQRWDLPENYRGVPGLPTEAGTGKDKCIGCGACMRMCPQNAIKVVAEMGEDRKRRLVEFTLDAGVCMWCGLCTEVCPTRAIVMTRHYELASFDRESLLYPVERLRELGGELPAEPEEETEAAAAEGGE